MVPKNNSASAAKDDVELRQKLQTLQKNTQFRIVGVNADGTKLTIQLPNQVRNSQGKMVSQVEVDCVPI